MATSILLRFLSGSDGSLKTSWSRRKCDAALAFRAGMCPGNHESGGKHLSGKPERESLAATDPDRNCPGRVEDQEHVSGGPIQTIGGPTREETHPDCRWPYCLGSPGEE